MILFDPSAELVDVLTLAVTVLLPVVVGLITKASTSAGVKATILAALSAVTAVANALIQAEGSVDLWPVVLGAVEIFVIAVATHFGFWKPTTVSEKAQAVLVKDDAGLAA